MSMYYFSDFQKKDVILSIGFFSAIEIEQLYKDKPPKYLEAYDPREDVFKQYNDIKPKCKNFIPYMNAVTGIERDAYLTPRKYNTSICFEKEKHSQIIKTISLTSTINRIYSEYSRLNKLLLNCEGSEIDIIQNTSSDILKLCNTIVVSFHMWVNEFNLKEEDYHKCLNKLSKTHKGTLKHKGRHWWEFKRNG